MLSNIEFGELKGNGKALDDKDHPGKFENHDIEVRLDVRIHGFGCEWTENGSDEQGYVGFTKVHTFLHEG